VYSIEVQGTPNYMTETIKEFFTSDEWDLIYNLVSNNRQFCEDDEYDPVETYVTVENKIHQLFASNDES
jgi:hypothetical protein